MSIFDAPQSALEVELNPSSRLGGLAESRDALPRPKLVPCRSVQEDGPRRRTAQNERLARALVATGRSELRRVRVKSYLGQVLLDGQVKSFYLKQLAQEAVRPLAAGRQICNRIAVIN